MARWLITWAAAAAIAAVPAPLPLRTAPPQDATTELVQALETDYAAALHLFQAGRLDEARAAFDSTLDRLLAVNTSIPDTPALQTELNSLLDRIHALESDVLPTGGLSSSRRQPDPVDRIPELTFPLDAATRAELAAASAASDAGTAPTAAATELPITLNDAVLRYVHYFTTTGREDLINNLRRAGRYRAMITRTLTQRGVPEELIFVAQLESSFDPTLVSRAGARGMWQFMAARSDDYGLKRTPWVDERQDPEKATAAAAHHLSDLHKEFGDWDLAMAAYNTGPGTIQRIVRRTGLDDYWQLYARHDLPKYVRNYVPVILATALIARDPAQYGITLEPPDAPYQVELEPLTSALSLRLAAECADVTVADLQHLNPSLLHLRAPAGFDLKVPEGAGSRFLEALSRVPAGERLTGRIHWVQPGDTWASLARRYQVSATALAIRNHLAAASTPLADTAVSLPPASEAPPAHFRKRKIASHKPRV